MEDRRTGGLEDWRETERQALFFRIFASPFSPVLWSAGPLVLHVSCGLFRQLLTKTAPSLMVQANQSGCGEIC